MQRLTGNLLVISFDGLSTLDFDYLATLPNFKEFLKNASYSRKVLSVYPTLTYPAHATIVTGKYPKNHGIINNTLFQPKRSSPDWYWQRKYIQGETFYDLALEKGMKVAALLWPVTARSKITYNIPEVLANRPWENQILVSLINGSPLYQLALNQKFGHLRNGVKQPELDDFTHQSLLYTLREKRPELTLVHYTDLDSMRHYHGFHSQEAQSALKRHDQRLGDILRTLRELKIEKESTIIVLGDHSSLDEDQIINLNVMFEKEGLLDVDSRGKLKDYRAIVKSCDGSAYVYLNPKYPKNLHMIKKVYQLLQEFKEKTRALEEIYSSTDATQWGADPKCTFLLEASQGYYFHDQLLGPILEKVKPEDIGVSPHRTKASHGYSPFKNDYTTVFIALGKGIRKGIELDEMLLVDEGPTLARLLGIALPQADGRVLEEILQL